MMKKIAVLGAGAFGFAIAKVIGENESEKQICIYDINDKFIEHIKKTREHPVFHEDTKLPENIIPTTDIETAVKDTDLLVLAIPTKYLRDAIKEFSAYLKDGVVFLNLAKGLELGTNMRISEILDHEIKKLGIRYEICILSGGMIAREVTLENPLCADIACKDTACAERVASLLRSDYLRIETTDDLIGVGLAGAFKNVIAIGAGIFDGLGYGESSKSAFVSAAAKEIEELAVSMGAKRSTFGSGSQAWFGDLMTTCFGASRNRELGELIGKGVSVRQAVEDMKNNNKSIEGYLTTKVVHKLTKEYGLKTPLSDGIYDVVYDNKDPKNFLVDFIRS